MKICFGCVNKKRVWNLLELERDRYISEFVCGLGSHPYSGKQTKDIPEHDCLYYVKKEYGKINTKDRRGEAS